MTIYRDDGDGTNDVEYHSLGSQNEISFVLKDSIYFALLVHHQVTSLKYMHAQVLNMP